MIALLLSALWGCGDPGTHLPGTTARVGSSKAEEGEVDLKILTSKDDCDATYDYTGQLGEMPPEDLEACLPYLDRAAGEVHVAFQLRLSDGNPYPLPLTREHIDVAHQGRKLVHGLNQMEVELKGHDPRPVPQLFVLLIDASSSMRETDGGDVTRMDKLRKALISKPVVDRFFPRGAKTGVVMLTFTDKTPSPVGGAMEVISSPDVFKRRVKEDLNSGSGYTHLYDAVRYSVTDLLKDESIKFWLEDAQPTIILMTDGFNNLSNAQTCGENAPLLDDLLKDIEEARNDRTRAIKSRPTLYAVGLGKPFSRKLTAKADTTDVQPQDLCGKWADYRIDGDLDSRGIDKVSLDWIAAIGGGFSYVQQDSKGLGEALQKAAAERFSWYELSYYVGGFELRRAFEVRLRLNAFVRAESAVVLEPSAWMDAPPGARPEGVRWAKRTPYQRSSALVMSVLGALVGFTFVGAALFNTRRALSARSPIRSRPRK